MNQTLRQGIITAIFLVILFGIGYGTSYYAAKLPSPAQKALGITTRKVLSYKGQDGKTVLELLKASHKVDVKDSQYGAVVSSIDDTPQTDTTIWVYYIDGIPAQEAADKAMTKNGQTIEW